jgi:hypothetical protein
MSNVSGHSASTAQHKLVAREKIPGIHLPKYCRIRTVRRGRYIEILVKSDDSDNTQLTIEI